MSLLCGNIKNRKLNVQIQVVDNNLLWCPQPVGFFLLLLLSGGDVAGTGRPVGGVFSRVFYACCALLNDFLVFKDRLVLLLSL